MPAPTTLSKSQNQGFSLAEMAVVITVIATMIGGIMLGQNMIRSSRLQTTIGKVSEYGSAVTKFRDRYMALPGDMPNATDMWGEVSSDHKCTGPFPSANDTYADDFMTPGTGTQTCNGNGDGIIGNEDNGCGVRSWEYFRVWKHLANAGLAPEGNSFTGFHGGSAGTDKFIANPGTNIPRTSIEGGGYTLRGCGNVTGDPNYFNGFYGHVIQVGNATNLTTSAKCEMSRCALFSASEAQAIDKKLDDSWPHLGNVMAPRSGDTEAPNCSNSNSGSPASADYNLSQGSTARCPLFFKLGF